jgi:hypothetical protein
MSITEQGNSVLLPVQMLLGKRKASPVLGLPAYQKVPDGQQEFSPYLISRMATAANECFCGVLLTERDPG